MKGNICPFSKDIDNFELEVKRRKRCLPRWDSWESLFCTPRMLFHQLSKRKANAIDTMEEQQTRLRLT